MFRAPFLFGPALDYFSMKATPRTFAFFLLFALFVFPVAGESADKPAASRKYLVFVGTYTTKTESKGIYEYEFDADTGKLTAKVRDEGKPGPNKERQDGPHAHWIETSPDNRFAFVADLGLDAILSYRFDASKGSLTPNKPFFLRPLTAGAGPRHATFSPGGGHFYVLSEIDSTVTAFAYAPDHGVFGYLGGVPMLPAGFEGRNDAAEIV